MPEMNERQIRDYLSDQGLTPAQVERVMYTYATLRTTGAGASATQMQRDLQGWLDNQVATYTGRASRPMRAPNFLDATRDIFTGAGHDESQRRFQAVAEMAREAAARRRQETAERTYRGSRIDHGPVMDPDVLANTMATGAWVDAEGNYIDPETGQRAEEPFPADANSIWHAIKGQRFNMGILAMPGGVTDEQRRSPSYYPHGYAYRTSAKGQPASDTMIDRRGRVIGGPVGPRQTAVVRSPNAPRTFITPSQALSLLSSMSEDYLIQLQHQMYDAGLYDEDHRPRWGHADAWTRDAFKKLFIEASLDPNKNVAAVLADLAIDLRDQTPPPGGSPGSGAGAFPAFTPTVGNVEALRQQIDQIATETVGGYLDPAAKDALVARLQEREVGLQRADYERQKAGTNIGPSGTNATMADVDAFLAALSGQESGGNYGAVNTGSGARGKYQIMPANWADWSRRAGLPPGSPQSPENQEIVARQIVMEYFERYGNWRDVAVAWYSGPGNVAQKRHSDRAQRGGPSINDYADSVMTRMSGIRRGAVAEGGAGGAFPAIEQFDPAAEAAAAIRAADPNAWQASEWGKRASDFFSVLGSVVGSVR